MLGLLSVIGQNMQYMNLVNMSTSIHRLAKGADKDPEVRLLVTQSQVFQELLNAIYSKLCHTQGISCLHQCLSNVTWSLAHLYTNDSELMALLATLSTQYMEGFKPFELSMLLWGFAKLGVVEGISDTIQALFQAASECIAANLSHFSFRSLSMIAWAFATVRQRDSQLFAALASEMCRTARNANCQEVGNTVWAFATAGHPDGKLLAAMVMAAMPQMSKFKAQEISNMLWGFATLGYWNEDLFLMSIQAAMRLDLGSQHIAIILWACAKVMPKHDAMEGLVTRFAPLCAARLGTFRPHEVCSTVQDLAKVLLPGPNEAGTVTERPLASAGAPLHEDVLALLEALAQWVASNSQALTPSAFTGVVSSLVFLGIRAERRVDLSLEPAVVSRAQAIPPAEKVTLLRAFLTYPWIAREAVGALAAGLSTAVCSLQPWDLQALGRMYHAAGNRPGTRINPSPQDLSWWCLALAAGLPFQAASMEPDKLEAIQDDGPDVSTRSDSSTGSYLETDPVSSHEHCIPTAESLPFLEWRPALS